MPIHSIWCPTCETESPTCVDALHALTLTLACGRRWLYFGHLIEDRLAYTDSLGWQTLGLGCLLGRHWLWIDERHWFSEHWHSRIGWHTLTLDLGCLLGWLWTLILVWGTLDRLAYIDSWLKMTWTTLADIGFGLLAWQTLTPALTLDYIGRHWVGLLAWQTLTRAWRKTLTLLWTQ